MSCLLAPIISKNTFFTVKYFTLKAASPWCFCHFHCLQAETQDGIPSNLTGDVIHRIDKDYGFVCLNKDQDHGLCRNYRVRFLCGKLGTLASENANFENAKVKFKSKRRFIIKSE